MEPAGREPGSSWSGGSMTNPRDAGAGADMQPAGATAGGKALMYTYATPEKVKQAKLEALQHKMEESVKHIQARLGDREDMPAEEHVEAASPGRASDANSMHTLLTAKSEPGGEDQFTAFIRPPRMGGNGKQTNSKLIMQGKARHYLRLQPDSKMRGAVQVDYGAFDAEAPAAASAHKDHTSKRHKPKQAGGTKASTDPRATEQLRHSMNISFVPVNVDMAGMPSKALMSSSHVYQQAARSGAGGNMASSAASKAKPPSTWQGFMNNDDVGPAATVTEENLSGTRSREGYRQKVDSAEKAAAATATATAAAAAAQPGLKLPVQAQAPAVDEAAKQPGPVQEGQSVSPHQPSDGATPLGQPRQAGVGEASPAAQPRPRSDAPAAHSVHLRSALPPRPQALATFNVTARSSSVTKTMKPSGGPPARSPHSGGLPGDSWASGFGPHQLDASERLSRMTTSTLVPTRKTMARCRSGRLFGQTSQHGDRFSTQTPSVAWLGYQDAEQQRSGLQYRVLEFRSWQVQQAAAGDRTDYEPGSDSQPPGARGRPESAPASSMQRASSLPLASRPLSALPGTFQSSVGGGWKPRPSSAVSCVTTAGRPGSAAPSAAALAKRVRPPSAGAWAGRPRMVELTQSKEEEEILDEGWDCSTSTACMMQLTTAGFSLPVPGS